MVFLVASVSFLAKSLTSFLVSEIFIEWYILIACTNAIVTFSLFNNIYSSLSFRSDAWMMETCEWFTFALYRIIFIPRYLILENVAVKFVAVITNLVGNSYF